MSSATVESRVPAYSRPLPQPDSDTKPYWESLREHQMRIQRCRACQRFYFPPTRYCPHCLSDDVVWTPVTGRGTVYSWVTYHRAYQPDYEGELPYNASIVELEEGVFVWTNVVGIPPSDVRVGLAVEVAYDDVTPEVTLARFRPSAS